MAHDLLERCQALPPAATPLLVAVSGGCDSMVLLDVLRRAGQWPVSVYHLDHQLRSDSHEDAALVRDYCARYEIPLHQFSADIAALAKANKQGIELYAREYRYRQLQEIAEASGVQHVCTAHHRDDHLESILMHYLRGAGDYGLAGMSVERQLGTLLLIRPFLSLTRAEIYDYAAAYDVPWREDSSNRDERYLRNHLRHTVIPALKEARPDLEDVMLSQAMSKREAINLRDAILDKEWQDCLDDGAVSLQLLRSWSSDVRTALWRRLLMHFQLPLSQVNIERLDALLTAAVSKKVELADWQFIRNPDCIAWYRHDEETVQPVLLQDAADISGLHFICSTADDVDPRSLSPQQACIKQAAVVGSLQLRRIRTGESWQAFGAPGRKNVFQFLSDKKYPQQKRASLIVLADDDGVLWIPGFTIAERARVNEGDEVLLVECGGV